MKFFVSVIVTLKETLLDEYDVLDQLWLWSHVQVVRGFAYMVRGHRFNQLFTIVLSLLMYKVVVNTENLSI